MKILLVKMSSLGDVVHCLPAVSDLASAGHEIHWVVEEAFAAIPASHPGVTRTIPIAWRRWRKRLGSSIPEMRAFIRELRSSRYDLVIDAQGLIKSAVVARLVISARRVGLDFDSVREKIAALFYTRRVAVPRNQHAVDRLRQLIAQAVDDKVPEQQRFGLTAPPLTSADNTIPLPDCLLLHGTTWASKHWPEMYWIELAQHLVNSGLTVQVPHGNDREQIRAERICEKSGATPLPRQSIEGLMPYLAGSRWVIGVDSGLLHLAAALGTRTIGLYGSTDHRLTGARGPAARNLAADFRCSPCLNHRCKYQGPPQYQGSHLIEPACYSRITPGHVVQIIEQAH